MRTTAFPPVPVQVRHSLARVNQLLGDIVEEVPATEGKRTLQESQGKVTHGWCHPEREGIGGPQLFKVSWGVQMSGVSTPPPNSLQCSHPGSTLEDLDKANTNDECQCQQLPAGEDILDARGPAHTGAVHPCQEH